MVGIYAIRNKLNGKMYIGKSENIKNRIYEHKTDCKSGRRKSPLYEDVKISSNGWDDFEVIVLEKCSYKDLDTLEKYYIAKYQTRDNEKGYNIIKGGKRGALGCSTKSTKCVKCGGVIFNSISECARYFKVSKQFIGQVLNGKCNSKRFSDLGLEYYNKED